MSHSKMNPLKGAVVGVGYLGRFHAQKIKQSAYAELVGVYDAFSSNAEKVSAELNVKQFNSLDEVVQSVDFVTIAASTASHYELAEFFLSKKVPVLVEKPIAATADLGLKLCELAERNKVTFSVGHIERFNPAYHEVIKNKSKVKYLELNRLAPFRTRGSDVSVLHDLTIHDIDLVQYIFGSPVVEFESVGLKMIRPTIDDVSIHLKLQNDVVVKIQNSRLTPQIVRNYRTVMSDKVLFMNTATLEGEYLIPDQSQADLHRIEKVQVQKVDALALEIDHFVKAVKGELPVAITPQEATAALHLVEKIVAQTRT